MLLSSGSGEMTTSEEKRERRGRSFYFCRVLQTSEHQISLNSVSLTLTPLRARGRIPNAEEVPKDSVSLLKDLRGVLGGGGEQVKIPQQGSTDTRINCTEKEI